MTKSRAEAKVIPFDLNPQDPARFLLMATPREERGEFDLTAATKTAALVSRGGRIKALGAGTRAIRCDTFSLLIRLEA